MSKVEDEHTPDAAGTDAQIRQGADASVDPDPADAEERVETPFDHPLFLPAVLLGLSLWFLWDGFIVPMEDHLTFNRVGFAVLALATLWFGYKGIQEMRADADTRSEGDGPGLHR